MLTAVSRHCHSSCCVCCTLCRSSNRRCSSSRECRSHVAAPLQEVSCPLQNNSEPQGRPASAKLKSSTAALDLPNKVSVPATPAGVASGIAAAGSAAKHCSSRLLKQSLNVSHHCRRREQRRSSRECCIRAGVMAAACWAKDCSWAAKLRLCWRVCCSLHVCYEIRSGTKV